MDNQSHITIFATPNDNRMYTLTDAKGNEVQEGFEYATKRLALDAAEKLWPKNSVWQGRAVPNGWRIKIN